MSLVRGTAIKSVEAFWDSEKKKETSLGTKAKIMLVSCHATGRGRGMAPEMLSFLN